MRDGLKANSSSTRKQTLQDIKALRIDLIKDMEVLNLFSDMFDYYIQTEENASLLSLGMDAFKHILPYTFGYRVKQAIKKNSYSSIGNLCRLYFNLYQEDVEPIIKPSLATINNLSDSIQLIKLTTRNKPMFEQLYQISWRFALEYPDTPIQEYFMQISSIHIQNSPIFSDDEFTEFEKKVHAVLNYQHPVTSEGLIDLISKLQHFEPQKDIQTRSEPVTRDNNFHEKIDLTKYDKLYTTYIRDLSNDSAKNEVLKNLKNLISELSLVRLKLAPVQISQYDDIYDKIVESMTSLNPITKTAPQGLKKHFQIKDRMSHDDSLFDI